MSFGTGGSAFTPVSDDAAFSWDQGGPGTTKFWGSESVLALAIQASGDIVAGGFTSTTHNALDMGEFPFETDASRFAMIRLRSTGGPR